MKREQHPEFAVYLQQKQRVEVARRAVAEWVESGEPLSGANEESWRVEDVQLFLREVQRLFAAYNRVLWQAFPYCRACGGACCVAGASEVTLADAVAMALLALPFPERPAQLAASARHCIYLEGGGCSWPQQWRPLKCWSFYCLGSGAAHLDASGRRYEEITASLQSLLDRALPALLRGHTAVTTGELRETLAEPIAFAAMLAAMLEELVVEPLAARYPYLYEVYPPGKLQLEGENMVESALAFIAEAGERLWDGQGEDEATTGGTREQLLADLEQLEWIVTAQPGNAALLLGQLVETYTGAAAPEGGAKPTLAYQLRGQALALLKNAGAR